MTNKEREEARNKLISEAIAYANKVASLEPREGSKEKWPKDWDLAFYTKLNALARESGLMY
jgi:hypothetical protein